MRASLTDRQLIDLYLSGDERAFESLLNRHQQQIYSKIYFIVRDADLANDLFQDTFIKVVNTLRSGKYNEEGKFLPWVMRIAHNLSIDHFRRNKKMRMCVPQMNSMCSTPFTATTCTLRMHWSKTKFIMTCGTWCNSYQKTSNTWWPCGSNGT